MPKKLLVLDDDEDTRMVLRDRLLSMGFDVVTENNGHSAPSRIALEAKNHQRVPPFGGTAGSEFLYTGRCARYHPQSPRRRVMLQFMLFAAVTLLGVSEVQAQTVSIANMDVSREAILIEAALTRFLRDDGHTVKGASTDGFVVLLHGMSAQTRQGASVGVVGSATVVKVLRRESTAALLPEGFPRAQEFVGTFTAVMGSPLIYLAGTTAIGGDAEEVAQVLRIYVKTVLQHPTFRASELLRGLEQRATEHAPMRSPETGK